MEKTANKFSDGNTALSAPTESPILVLGNSPERKLVKIQFPNGEYSMAILTVKRKKIRNLSIRILHAEALQINVPMRCSESAALDFLLSRGDWVARNIFRMKSAQKDLQVNLGEILLLGTGFSIVNNPNMLGYTVDIEKKEIESNLNLSHKYVRRKWLIHYALRHLSERTEYYAKLHNFSYKKISTKHQISRWGSCTSDGNLTFNSRLILTPPFVVDAIVCHELAHTKIMSHNDKFYSLLHSIYPETLLADKWLKKYGLEIMRM